jgi:hypothetical protein
MSGSAIQLTVHIMYADLLFAFELHKARHNDMLRQAEEYRLGRRSRKAIANLTPAATHRARPSFGEGLLNGDDE